MLDRQHVTLLTTMPDHCWKFRIVSGIGHCLRLFLNRVKKKRSSPQVGYHPAKSIHVISLLPYLFYFRKWQKHTVLQAASIKISDLSTGLPLLSTRGQRNAIQSRAARTFATWGKWWACVRWGSSLDDEKTKERRRDTPSSSTALLEGEEKMEFF